MPAEAPCCGPRFVPGAPLRSRDLRRTRGDSPSLDRSTFATGKRSAMTASIWACRSGFAGSAASECRMPARIVADASALATMSLRSAGQAIARRVATHSSLAAAFAAQAALSVDLPAGGYLAVSGAPGAQVGLAR
jgi:hypothetical protein